MLRTGAEPHAREGHSYLRDARVDFSRDRRESSWAGAGSSPDTGTATDHSFNCTVGPLDRPTSPLPAAALGEAYPPPSGTLRTLSTFLLRP